MADNKQAIPFFTDNCVPDSVGNTLYAAGHKVTRLRNVMDRETADPVIAVACSKHGQVLVTNDADFKTLAKRLSITQRQYHDTLHRIQLRCFEPEAAARISEALSLIEAEWKLIADKRPMVIEVRSSTILVRR